MSFLEVASHLEKVHEWINIESHRCRKYDAPASVVLDLREGERVGEGEVMKSHVALDSWKIGDSNQRWFCLADVGWLWQEGNRGIFPVFLEERETIKQPIPENCEGGAPTFWNLDSNFHDHFVFP